MLYQLYEARRALLSPFAGFASASSKLYNHPLSLFTHTPMAHRTSAGLDLMYRLWKDYEKPEFDINSVVVDGVNIAVQEQVAIEKPFCRLLRFKRYTDDLPIAHAHEGSAHGADRGAPVGTPFDAAARHGALDAPRVHCRPSTEGCRGPHVNPL